MPIYEYQCTSCCKKTEILQKISDTPLTQCPHCHENALQKLVSSTRFQLKGSGWYVTDFRDKNKPKAPTNPETAPPAKNDTKTKESKKPKTKKEQST